MKTFDISINIKAPAQQVWDTLVDFDGYQHWNSFMPYAKGDLNTDKTIFMRAKYREEAIPIRVEAVIPKERLILSRNVFHKVLVHLTHYFELNDMGNGETRFTQRWEGQGLLSSIMWKKLCKVMAEFESFNADLKAKVEGSV